MLGVGSQVKEHEPVKQHGQCWRKRARMLPKSAGRRLEGWRFGHPDGESFSAGRRRPAAPGLQAQTLTMLDGELPRNTWFFSSGPSSTSMRSVLSLIIV